MDDSQFRQWKQEFIHLAIECAYFSGLKPSDGSPSWPTIADIIPFTRQRIRQLRFFRKDLSKLKDKYSEIEALISGPCARFISECFQVEGQEMTVLADLSPKRGRPTFSNQLALSLLKILETAKRSVRFLSKVQKFLMPGGELEKLIEKKFEGKLKLPSVQTNFESRTRWANSLKRNLLLNLSKNVRLIPGVFETDSTKVRKEKILAFVRQNPDIVKLTHARGGWCYLKASSELNRIRGTIIGES